MSGSSALSGVRSLRRPRQTRTLLGSEINPPSLGGSRSLLSGCLLFFASASEDLLCVQGDGPHLVVDHSHDALGPALSQPGPVALIDVSEEHHLC